MGVDVYVEDQVHGRTYAGPDAGWQLSRVLARAEGESLLGGVDVHGDTMFNMVQLQLLDAELDGIAVEHPELGPDVDS